MAIINKTGITNGTTIQAEHVTRAIDALSGVGTDTVIASGSFSGSLTGLATTATTATNATNTAVTNTSTGTGPYYITFVESATGNVGQRVDATGLTYNATTDTITATASFATTASFALNAGGGAGVGFPFTGSAQVTGSMGITGSLNVTGGVTASLFGTASRAVTASFADLSRQVLVQRTVADADHFMVIVDSGNATPAAESLNTVTNIRVNPGTDTISAVTVTGSFNVTGSMSAVKFATVDFSVIASGSGGTGQFVIPVTQTSGTPKVGSMYYDDSTATLYIYSANASTWIAIT